MKKEIYTSFSKYSLIPICLLLFFVFYGQSAKACVDPDTVATLTLNYSADFSEVEIRIGNLKLETSAPNTFCSCGLSSETAVFTYVTYIAMVYQGTNTIYPNFIPFMQTSPADAAWDGSQPALPDWNGYIAEVINGGLVADEAVEMVIRAEAPPGVLVEVSGDPQSDTSAFYYQTYLGTDEWDPNTIDLKEDHQAIRTFGFMNDITVNIMPQSYFDDLDATLLTSVYEVGNAAVLAGKLSPNPVSQSFELSFNLQEASDLKLVIYDVFGRAVHSFPAQKFSSGKHTLSISVDGILQKSGIYIASLQGSSGQSNFKFLKQ